MLRTMAKFSMLNRLVGSATAAMALLLLAPCAAALAASLDIPVVLPLSGNAAFLGQGERDALTIQESEINKRGGVGGVPLHYVFHDDQSSPQVAVQLANQIVAQHPAAVLGSAIVAMCSAMAPIFAAAPNGPVMYCFSPGIHPASGTKVFSSYISTRDLAVALVRYYRGRGLTRVAMITSTDASGQDGRASFTDAFQLPENRAMRIVADERFAPTDVSVSAQIEQVKASGAQALIAWTSGAPFGTVLKSIAQSGLEIPVATTDANMTLAQMKQYGSYLPGEALFMSAPWPPHQGVLSLEPAAEAAQQVMLQGYRSAGRSLDNCAGIAWDPGMLIVAAYTKLGPSATPEQIRAFLAGMRGWSGINGTYDFVSVPQRGLNATNALVTRWQSQRSAWAIVSRPGGDPL